MNTKYKIYVDGAYIGDVKFLQPLRPYQIENYKKIYAENHGLGSVAGVELWRDYGA